MKPKYTTLQPALFLLFSTLLFSVEKPLPEQHHNSDQSKKITITVTASDKPSPSSDFITMAHMKQYARKHPVKTGFGGFGALLFTHGVILLYDHRNRNNLNSLIQMSLGGGFMIFCFYPILSKNTESQQEHNN